jgi:alpha 1,2-mannosyltransferase
MEARFNWKFGYPYIFLNEEPFSAEFKNRTTEAASSGTTHYGLIPHDHWFQPSWVNETLASENRNKMKAEGVLYGDLVSYRNMCRFNSGFFYKHPLLKDLEWYWRIEPSVDYYCDVDYDPFLWMEKNKKVYGFNVAIYEFRKTIETLWPTVKDFATKYPHHISRNNAMSFLSDNGGKEYNLCHFWSNFEIASLDFFRSKAYQDYFEFLDKTGGFYYERWGDAPVHSIAVSLFLPKDKIQFFNDIGYRHGPYTHCPRGKAYQFGHCYCDPRHNFDYDGYSCMPRWDRLWK